MLLLPIQWLFFVNTSNDVSADRSLTIRPSLVDVAISVPMFLLLVLGTIDFGYLEFTKLTLQNAVREAGRHAITEQCTGDVATCSESRYNSIIQELQSASHGLLDPNNSSNISITCMSTGGGCPTPTGGPGDKIVITVIYQYHFLPLLKPYTITVRSAFTNQKFPPSES
ncbi:MAG: TadE/TadG family type IV pilus assembly protein [Terriglobales bacterium]